MTLLDEKLREIAVNDWEKFTRLIGEHSITSAKICLLRQQNYSYRMIEGKLSVSIQTTRTVCKSCPS